MQISAASLIGPRSVAGAAGFQAIDPASGATRAQFLDIIAARLTLGSGQFCTNPGLVIGVDGPALRGFEAAAAAALAELPATAMLSPGICRAYDAGVQRIGSQAGVEALGQGAAGELRNSGRAAPFATDAATFLTQTALHDEVFGPASIVVRCADLDAMHAVIARLEGQLTAALSPSNGA